MNIVIPIQNPNCFRRHARGFFTDSLKHEHKERRIIRFVHTAEFGHPPVVQCLMLHQLMPVCRFPRHHVYNVVSNVADYKHFVPWCIDSVVRPGSNPNAFDAELAVGFQLFSERYLSKVTVIPNQRVVSIAKNTQLFHHLENEWGFQQGPDAGSTWLSFKVDFQFRSLLYAQASNLFFDEVVNKMVAAFDQRCRDTWEPERERLAAVKREAPHILSGAGKSTVVAPLASGPGRPPASPSVVLTSRRPATSQVAANMLGTTSSSSSTGAATRAVDFAQKSMGIRQGLVQPSDTASAVELPQAASQAQPDVARKRAVPPSLRSAQPPPIVAKIVSAALGQTPVGAAAPNAAIKRPPPLPSYNSIW